MPGQPRGWAGATQLGGLTTSECKFQSSLHKTGRNRSYAGNLPEISKTHGIAGTGKAGRVESIKHFPAELETVAFVKIPILRDGRIDGLDGWTLEHVLSAVTEGARGVIGERRGIEIVVQPIR